ncbi:hypothetical protein LMH87_001127 [Akanthomyces muscarius]|uniref:Uncharacterized protein n=1 Tax=Akanthomyces muscarius TaxID=2231603 RepID=A0A9W8QGS4_AKAMU|nr:hypothetical protein LMH87_001127 [Akanthomyces muscarius]KAJ4155904.1 hypothetical protein LMH87_001127 [Akanthomyces muscarius]
MSFLDKGVDGGPQTGGSDSSGDATPTPRTPTNEFFPRNGRLTPSPHYSRPRSIVAAHNDGGATRQDLRHIWEDANRQAHAANRAHVVFPESPNSFDYDTTSTQRGVGAMPAPARVDTAQVDANEWAIGLERLRLTESVAQQTQTSSDIPNRLQGSSYPYHARFNAASYVANLEATSAAQPAARLAAEPAAQPRNISIWSTYGAQTSPDNGLRNGGIASMPHPYSSHSAPRPARADPAPNFRSRASSETSFNGSGSLPPAQRNFNGSGSLTQAQPSFAPQLSHPVPMRMGQSFNANLAHNRTASGPDSYQPEPFYLQPRNQGFLPMHAVRASREPASTIAAHPSSSFNFGITAPTSHPAVPSTRFSDRYHGMHTETNASAEHLSAEQNASLWITNLPPDITHRELLAQIRGVGRIWCCFINGPDGLKHTTAAAKVVFFLPAAAQRLLQNAVEHGLQVRGFRAKVTQNRIKTGETIPKAGDDSRVLIVTGQASFVNEATLTEYFGQRFVFQVDEVRELLRGGGRAVVEFRFGSYRCQSQMGKISLEKDRPVGFEKAEFGEDPCEVGENWSSHAIAVLRIRGIGL